MTGHTIGYVISPSGSVQGTLTEWLFDCDKIRREVAKDLPGRTQTVGESDAGEAGLYSDRPNRNPAREVLAMFDTFRVDESDIDRDVRTLLREEYDDLDSLLIGLRERVEDGDQRLLEQLAGLVMDDPGSVTADVDDRCMIMETLASVRAPDAGGIVADVLRRGLKSPIEDLRFAAVSAAGLLPKLGRRAFKNAIRELAEESEESLGVRKAAAAFLQSA